MSDGKHDIPGFCVLEGRDIPSKGAGILLWSSKLATKRLQVILTLGLLASTSVLFLVRELSESRQSEEPEERSFDPIDEPVEVPLVQQERLEHSDQTVVTDIQEKPSLESELVIDEAEEKSEVELEPEPESQPETAPVPEPELSTIVGTSTPIGVKEEATNLYLALTEKYGTSNKGRLKYLFSRWSDGPTPEERRLGLQRLSCSLEVHCVTTTSYHQGRIRNLSLGGAEVELDFEPARGSRLGLHQVEGETSLVTGNVIWVSAVGENYRVGLEFDLEAEELSQTWIAQNLYELGASTFLERPPRKFVRVEVEVDTTLMLDDGVAIEVTLLDLSLGGCLLKTQTILDVPEITLRLGKVNCRGMIVQTRQDQSDGAWHHHIRFKPFKRLERIRLRRTLLLLLKSRASEAV